MAETDKPPLDLLIQPGRAAGDAAQRAVRQTVVTRARRAFGLPEATYPIDEREPQTPAAGTARRPLAHLPRPEAHYDERRLDAELAGLQGEAIGLAGDPPRCPSTSGSATTSGLLAYLQRGYWEPSDLVDACVGLPRPGALAVIYALD